MGGVAQPRRPGPLPSSGGPRRAGGGAGFPPRRRRGRPHDPGGPAGVAEAAVSVDAGPGGRVGSGTNRGGTHNLHPVPPGGTPGALMKPIHLAPLSPARSGAARLALLVLPLFAASGCLGSFAPPPVRPGMIREQTVTILVEGTPGLP